MRLQFELNENRVKEFDTLVEKLGLKTRVQLFDLALTLVDWCVEEIEAGRIITSMNEQEGTYKEMVMPGLRAKKPISSIAKTPAEVFAEAGISSVAVGSLDPIPVSPATVHQVGLSLEEVKEAELRSHLALEDLEERVKQLEQFAELTADSD